MTAAERYLGYLRTRSGSQDLLLELAADTARAVIRYRWMGQQDVPGRCELRFRHRRVSAHHGLLELVEAATAPDDDSELQPVPALTEEQALLPLIVEYLRLPETATHIHPESALQTMSDAGYADWNRDFELLLLVDDPEGWPTDRPWSYLHSWLDKTKLARLEPDSDVT